MTPQKATALILKRCVLAHDEENLHKKEKRTSDCKCKTYSLHSSSTSSKTIEQSSKQLEYQRISWNSVSRFYSLRVFDGKLILGSTLSIK